MVRTEGIASETGLCSDSYRDTAHVPGIEPVDVIDVLCIDLGVSECVVGLVPGWQTAEWVEQPVELKTNVVWASSYFVVN